MGPTSERAASRTSRDSTIAPRMPAPALKAAISALRPKEEPAASGAKTVAIVMPSARPVMTP